MIDTTGIDARTSNRGNLYEKGFNFGVIGFLKENTGNGKELITTIKKSTKK